MIHLEIYSLISATKAICTPVVPRFPLGGFEVFNNQAVIKPKRAYAGPRRGLRLRKRAYMGDSEAISTSAESQVFIREFVKDGWTGIQSCNPGQPLVG